jgi:hypothetical protein
MICQYRQRRADRDRFARQTYIQVKTTTARGGIMMKESYPDIVEVIVEVPKGSRNK